MSPVCVREKSRAVGHRPMRRRRSMAAIGNARKPTDHHASPSVNDRRMRRKQLACAIMSADWPSADRRNCITIDAHGACSLIVLEAGRVSDRHLEARRV
eukprot:5708442-Alexandrium_andersonii.AAC.1